MMDGEAIKELIGLVRSSNEPTTVFIHGVPHALNVPRPVPPPSASRLELNTLTGLVDFVKNEGDEDLLTVHVVSHEEVALLGELDEGFRVREHFATASCANLRQPFPFDIYVQSEAFIVGLQSRFVQTDELAKILSIVGNIREDDVKTHTDDGITQTVTARVGIAKLGEADVPNPVALQPFRTFAELEQPESLFVLRLKEGSYDKPDAALFEADGGAWKLEAILSIRDWLRERLPKITIIA